MIRQIPYNNSAATMRFEIPIDWDIDSLTGINIDITNLEGSSLLDATAATLYTATTTNATGSVGDSTVTLASGATAVVPGDRLRIAASAAGPSEEIEVLSYNSSTKVATLRHELRYAHTTGTAVKGLWATYNLDTSTVATWTKGLQVVIRWTPGGSDDIPVKERGEVSAVAFSFPDFARRFEILYPREWRITEYRTKEIMEESFLAVQMDLSSRDLDVNRLINQEMIHPAILAKARWIVVRAAGDAWESEREVALEEYNRQIEILTNQPIWLDENQDDVQDDVEIDDYAGFLGLERGF